MRYRTGLLAAAVLLGGCTVPTNDEPVELTGSIPSGFLQTTTTTTTTTIPEAVTKEVTVFLLETVDGRGRLVGVPRNVDVAAGVQEVLSNLFTVRPDGEERPAERGLTSSIPESATLLSATRAGDSRRLVVDVRGLFGTEGGIQGVDLRNALAQIVWTATQDPDVAEVSFRNNGQPVQALVDDGEIAEGPVNRSNYSRDG